MGLGAAMLGAAIVLSARGGAAAPDAGAPEDDAEPWTIGRDAVSSTPKVSPVNTPLPLYVDLPPGRDAAGAILWYKLFGTTHYRRLEMTRMGKGFGALIPCGDVDVTGDFVYVVMFFDDQDRIVGWLGSRKEPLHVEVVNSFDGDRPRFPGQQPPEACPPEEIQDPECALRGESCSALSPGTWPYPLPRARPRGCAGCTSSPRGPEGAAWALVGPMITVARARRRSRRERRGSA